MHRADHTPPTTLEELQDQTQRLYDDITAASRDKKAARSPRPAVSSVIIAEPGEDDED
jgi:hypothetical protein